MQGENKMKEINAVQRISQGYHKEKEHIRKKRRGHRMSDKTLLDLFVLLDFSDESHLLWLTARGAHIKQEHSRDKRLFLHNEQDTSP